MAVSSSVQPSPGLCVGSKVVQYDYVSKREACGEVVAFRDVYSSVHDNDITLAEIRWSDADGGVTTSHRITEFSAIAGRSELLLAGI